MTGNLRARVQVESKLLAPKLYEGMAASLASADQRAKGRMHTKYPFLRPQLARVEMREFLESETLPGGWIVRGDSRLMGQLYLEQPEYRMRLQFLKERRKRYPGGVPPAGHSQARRRTWRQPPLFTFETAPERELRLNHLLLLWDYASKPGTDTAFSLRVVHTIEAGEYGKAVRCDLNFEIRAGGEVFESLAFQGDPQEQDFFPVEIDKGENEG